MLYVPVLRIGLYCLFSLLTDATLQTSTYVCRVMNFQECLQYFQILFKTAKLGLLFIMV